MMRLNKSQQKYILITLKEMREEIEAASIASGIRDRVDRERLEEIDKRIARLQKLLQDEHDLVREFDEH